MDSKQLYEQISSTKRKYIAICSEMKYDEDVSVEIKKDLEWCVELLKQAHPIPIYNCIFDLYETIKESVRFLNDCRQLGW